MQKRYTPYYRVSTKKQGQSGLGLKAQKDAVLRFINYNQEILIGEFQEVVSGKNNQRVELENAIEYSKQNSTTLLIAISCLLVSGVLSCGFLKVNNVFGQSECVVPTVEFVTEYQNDQTYHLSEGFEGFIVKQWNPSLSVEYFEQNSIQLTSAMNNSSGHLARLWQVKDYQQIDFFVNGSLGLGEIADNTQVDLVLIDNDSFETRIENENQNILTTKQPSFVQYIQFVTTHTGN